jgi:D-alanine-D-alanine ligase
VPQRGFNFPFQRAVIVADLISNDTDTPIHLRRDLEQTDTSTLSAVSSAIERLGLPVCHYEHPKLLATKAAEHLEDVILSIFGGAVSRNRMALVPAICETFGLRYVGPDVYGRIICQNKEVSKDLACAAGLKTARHRIVRSSKDLRTLADCPLPFVAKPLWEGSSIGIGPDSLVTRRDQGERIVSQLLNYFDQPIMVESFIPGREVSWCFIEAPALTFNRSFAEVIWDGDPTHFDDNLYDAQHKLESEERRTIRAINEELRTTDSDAMERLLRLIGRVGYGRIDGKLNHGEFVFLELTPDAWLGPTGTFVRSFADLGVSLEHVMAMILLSARSGLQGR